MAPMVLAAVMDELARRVQDAGAITRAYGWPNPVPAPPAFVVYYPDTIDLDSTMNRGSDRAVFPCYAFFGNPDERSSRDVMSGFLSDLKTALDGAADGIWQSARASSIAVQIVPNDDGTEFLTARFTVDVIT